jgi:protein involved in polysaccharide export with SLBB domain
MNSKIKRIMNKRTIFYLSLFLASIIISISLNAQTKGLSTGTEQLFQDEIKFNQSEKLPTEVVPVGNIVIPEYYYIGPGDLISVQVLNLSPNPQIISVGSDCKILLTRAGEIDLKDKTLTEAIILIKAKYKEKNPKNEIFVTLNRPRTVLVTFTGAVKLPGTYALPASYRVSTAIKSVNQYTDSKQQTSNEISELIRQNEEKNQYSRLFYSSGISNFKSYSRRHIIIKRSNGESHLLDLDKAETIISYTEDPFIREGDEINIPFEPQDFPTISIAGPVANPGIFAFRNGDRCSMLIKFGRGFRDNADLNNIQLYKPGNSSPIQIKIDSNMNVLGDDYELTPFSRIIIGQKPIAEKNLNGFVSVTGCVKSPTVYMIKNNETHLKEVIEAAGGFTEKAYLPLSYVMRYKNNSYDQVEKRREIMQNFRNSTLTLQDTVRFVIDETYKNPIVSCDFVQLFESGSEKDNIKLSDGDIIVVPEIPFSVYVYGQVKKPGFVPFEKGRTMQWYIEQAGGFSETAQKSRSRIIRGLNKVWIEGNDKNLVYAGDEIYVPRYEDLPPGVELQNYAVIAGILTSAAALINLILYMFTKK